MILSGDSLSHISLITFHDIFIHFLVEKIWKFQVFNSKYSFMNYNKITKLVWGEIAILRVNKNKNFKY